MSPPAPVNDRVPDDLAPVNDRVPDDLTRRKVVEAVQSAGGSWTDVDVRADVASTNMIALAAGRSGAVTGTCFVADHQSAGRGRMARRWEAPPGTSAMFSVVLRVPAAPPAGQPGGPDPGLLPLAAGLAVCEAVSAVAGVDARLKWPNDVLIETGAVAGKCAGLLAEADGKAGIVVIGAGVNVSMTAAQLPVPTATSLLLAGAADVSRAQLVGVALARLEHWYSQWLAGAGAGVVRQYRTVCLTIGQDVTVDTPAGRLAGRCIAVGSGGELVVEAGGRTHRLVAGDVTHVRTFPGPA